MPAESCLACELRHREEAECGGRVADMHPEATACRSTPWIWPHVPSSALEAIYRSSRGYMWPLPLFATRKPPILLHYCYMYSLVLWTTQQLHVSALLLCRVTSSLHRSPSPAEGSIRKPTTSRHAVQTKDMDSQTSNCPVGGRALIIGTV